jgi:hypothetical protein
VTRRLIALGLAAGIASGAIAASAVPGHHTRTVTASAPLPRAVPARIGRREQVAPGSVRLRRAGSLRETTLGDPRGGPPWILRTFLGRRIVPKGLRRSHVNPVVGHGWCAELGRRYHGRLGWIDATNTFHAGHDIFGAMPVLCGSRLPDMRGMPLYGSVIRITDPSSPVAHVTEFVAYGIGGPATTAVDITTPGRVVHPALDRNGGFVAMLPRLASPADVRVTLHYGTTRAAITFDGYGPLGRWLPSEISGGPTLPRIAPAARATPDAFAPDPLGGVPYATAAVRDSSGDWCSSPGGGRLVDGRVGTIEARLGTFLPISNTQLELECASSRQLIARRPLSFSYGGGYALDRGADETGRIARRAQHGIFDISGIARPDVKQIIIATPRDVRTVIPGPNAHSFIVVYDGQFVSGEITLTSIFADGHRHTDRIGHLGSG